MGIEVTRVHVEMSVEDYDAFREWQKSAEETETRTMKLLAKVRDDMAHISTDIMNATGDAGCFVYVKNNDYLKSALDRAIKYFS